MRNMFKFCCIFCSILSFSVLFSGCSVFNAPPAKPAPTPMEIQAIQSHEFDAPKGTVFNSVLSVLQDDGYIVNSADINTGFITADGASNSFNNFFTGISGTTSMKATAFIEKIGSKTRVRLNFVQINKYSSQYGQTDQNDTPILDQDLYKNIFNRVENEVFVRKSTK